MIVGFLALCFPDKRSLLCAIDLFLLILQLAIVFLNSERIFVEVILYLTVAYNFYIKRIQEIHNLY
jgi:hypothetical protein